MLNTRNVIVKRCKCNYLIKKSKQLWSPQLCTRFYFLPPPYYRSICAKNFLSDAVLTFFHLQNFLELLLSTLNYGIIFAHNANVQWRGVAWSVAINLRHPTKITYFMTTPCQPQGFLKGGRACVWKVRASFVNAAWRCSGFALSAAGSGW